MIIMKMILRMVVCVCVCVLNVFTKNIVIVFLFLRLIIFNDACELICKNIFGDTYKFLWKLFLLFLLYFDLYFISHE